MANLRVDWHSDGRTAQHPPDPAYPEGKPVDVSNGARATCSVDLPYPAPSCGIWVVVCPDCGLRLGFTAAGRIDDPRRVTVACQLGPTGEFPHGKLNDSDEGALTMAISHAEFPADHTVMIQFGTKVSWIGLPQETAIEFALNILKHAGVRSVEIKRGGDDADQSLDG